MLSKGSAVTGSPKESKGSAVTGSPKESWSSQSLKCDLRRI
jgi:hypothetical protein